jgi:hypothetical protein
LPRNYSYWPTRVPIFGEHGKVRAELAAYGQFAVLPEQIVAVYGKNRDDWRVCIAFGDPRRLMSREQALTPRIEQAPRLSGMGQTER